MAGLGLVHSLYRAHRAVVPATAWHLVYCCFPFTVDDDLDADNGDYAADAGRTRLSRDQQGTAVRRQLDNSTSDQGRPGDL